MPSTDLSPRRCPPMILNRLQWRRPLACALWLICPLLTAGCPSSTPTAPPQPPEQTTDAAAEPAAGASTADQAITDTPQELPPTEGGAAAEPASAAELATDEREVDGDVAPTDPRPLQSPGGSADSDEAAETDPDQLAPYGGKDPAELAAEKAFAAPEGMRQLSPDARLWIDVDRGRLVVDGYVTLREGPLEMFACPVGTKEHESVVAVLSRARYVHAGLLAIGAMPGTPVSFAPEYRPATGQRIAIWVMWRDAEGEIQKVPAQKWVEKSGTGEPLEADWVFAGSSFWRDPETGQEHYQADAGDLVCVSNFTTATLDLPVESSQSNAALQYSAFTENLPPRGTPVRLVFVPIPLPADEPDPQAENAADPRAPPEDELLEVQEEDIAAGS